MLDQNIENIIKTYECPISLAIMSDPVIAQDGCTYEREAILRYIEESSAKDGYCKSPITKEIIGSNFLVPNKLILSQIKEFITNNPQYLEEVYFPEASFTTAITAIKTDNVENLRRLIDQDKRILEKSFEKFDNKSLFAIVCEMGSTVTLRLVLESLKKFYPQINFSNEEKARLLEMAFKQGGEENLTVLEQGFNWVEAKFIIEQIEKGNLGLIEILVKSNILDVNKIVDENDNTLLHIATINNQPNIIRFLILSGANSKQLNKEELRAEYLFDFLLEEDICQWRTEKKIAPFIKRIDAQEQMIVQQQQEIALLKTSLGALLERQRQKDAKKQRIQSLEIAQLNMKAMKSIENEQGFVNAFLVSEFLNYIVRGDLEKVKMCINTNPGLVFVEGDVIDLSARTFKSITAFQYAVWALDKEMWELLLTQLPLIDAHKQLNILRYERQDIIKTYGIYFTFDPLLAAYQRYLENFDTWYHAKHYDKMEVCWCGDVGSAQHKVPAWFVHLSSEQGKDKAWPTQNFTLPFSRSNSNLLTEWFGFQQNGEKLGVTFALRTSGDFVATGSISKVRRVEEINEVVRAMSNCKTLKAMRETEIDALTNQLLQASLSQSMAVRIKN